MVFQTREIQFTTSVHMCLDNFFEFKIDSSFFFMYTRKFTSRAYLHTEFICVNSVYFVFMMILWSLTLNNKF